METRTRMAKAIGAAVVVAGVFVAMNYHTQAGTATATMGVSATVISNCTISTAALAFGNYDPVVANASSGLAGTGTVTVNCTKGATVSIALDNGANASGAQRRLKNGTVNFLDYELYSDSGHTTTWNATNVVNPYGGTSTSDSKAAKTTTVYGLVASNQDATVGAYSDTVTATVTF